MTHSSVVEVALNLEFECRHLERRNVDLEAQNTELADKNKNQAYELQLCDTELLLKQQLIEDLCKKAGLHDGNTHEPAINLNLMNLNRPAAPLPVTGQHPQIGVKGEPGVPLDEPWEGSLSRATSLGSEDSVARAVASYFNPSDLSIFSLSRDPSFDLLPHTPGSPGKRARESQDDEALHEPPPTARRSTRSMMSQTQNHALTTRGM